MGDGERDSIALCSHESEVDAWVTGDYLAFMAATRQGLKVWMLPNLVVELAERAVLGFEVAESILVAIRPRYRKGAIEQSVVRLQVGNVHSLSSDARLDQCGELSTPSDATVRGVKHAAFGSTSYVMSLRSR